MSNSSGKASTKHLVILLSIAAVSLLFTACPAWFSKVTNKAPTARAEANPSVVVVENQITLDGSGSSDPENDNLDYSWTIMERPQSAYATIDGSNGRTAYFTPDIAGEYKIRLTVSDPQGDSDSTEITIHVISNDATLASLSAGVATLSPEFNPAEQAYTASVSNDISTIVLSATPTHATSTITPTDIGQKSLNVGENQFSITVTAENNAQLVYTITITRQSPPLSSDTSLTLLAATNVELNPGFNKDITEYTATVPNLVSATTIYAAATDSNSTINGDGFHSLAVGDNHIVITVTAEDESSGTYTIDISREAVASSDASLSGLETSVGTLSPSFSPIKYSYTTNVANSVTNIVITATANHSGAIVEGDGNKNLNVGANTFNITITAQDDVTKRYYQLVVYRADVGASSDSTLSGLTVSPGTLDPAFDPGTTEYTVDLAYVDETILITATKSDTKATLSGDTGSCLVAVGANTFTITVTAEDASYTEYTITADRAISSEDRLADLSVDGYDISPDFDSDTFAYTLNVGNSIDLVAISATALDEEATIAGTGEKPLSIGENIFYIMVTAADTIHSEVYTLTINRASETASDDSTLGSLSVDAGALDPAFSPTVQSYDIDVAHSTDSITIFAEPSDAKASLSGAGTKQLLVGENALAIVVTAEDGSKTTYTINVVRAASSEAGLASLTVEGLGLAPEFNAEILDYTVNAPNELEYITIAAEALDGDAGIAGTGSFEIAEGSNDFDVTVTAPDEVTQITYSITVNRASAAASSDATLSSLTVDGHTLTPDFNPQTNSYSVDVESSVSNITISATATDTENATISGDIGQFSLDVGENYFDISVTAEDGTKKYYYLTVNKAGSNDATLYGLTVYPGTLDPAFSSETTNYSVEVDYSVTTVNITAYANDQDAEVFGDGEKSLEEGENPFSIVVTAGDGETTKTYYLTITRLPLASADVTVLITLNSPEDIAITFNGTQALLNKLASETMFVYTSISGATSYEWRLDGSATPISTYSSVTIDSSGIPVLGWHTLSLIVQADYKLYSAEFDFEVVEE
jgi:hypothetical protein